MSKGSVRSAKVLALLLAVGASALLAQDPSQAQIDAIKGVLPKFAIPMREVGDRFQDMYFAAKGGNWGLAAYMSKYMDKAMGPASLTKPAEYPVWRAFYDDTFAPVNKAIAAQDLKAFTAAYDATIKACNQCHKSMDYGFISVVRQKAPSDQGIRYDLPSKASDVPK